MYNYNVKNIVSLYIIFISILLFSNSYNVYGQTSGNKEIKLNSTDKDIQSLKQNITTINKNINSINGNISTLTKSINSNLNTNNTGAISTPVGNITNLFGRIGPWIPIIFLAIVAMTMSIPLVIDMIMAYRRSSKGDKADMTHPAVGMEGLYRTLMTFGVVLLAGIVLLYLLLLITIYNNTALLESLRNLSTILGTGLATIIAFYFGTRGTESAVQKAAKRLAPPGTIGDLSIPSVIKTKPIHEAKDVPIKTDIYAKFSEPMDINSVNKGTFTIVDSKNNVVDGEVSFIENNTKALFKVTNKSQSLDPGTDYTATIESEVTDVEGNSMYKDKVWTFTTKEEEPPPGAVDKKPTIQEASKNPSEGQMDVDLKPTEMSFAFDTDMDESTINIANIQFLEKNNPLTALEYDVKVDSTNKKKISISLKRQLTPKTQYTIKVSPSVKDTNGKSLESEQTWSFTTK
jgi:hypothetical protein